MLGRKVIYVRCINCSYNNVAKGIRLFEKRHFLYRRRAQYWRTKRGFAFFCLQEPIYNVLVIFFCSETRGVRPPC